MYDKIDPNQKNKPESTDLNLLNQDYCWLTANDAPRAELAKIIAIGDINL